MKTKITLLLLLMFSIGFAQENTSGEIIISRENLISLLKKFKKQNVVVSSNENAAPLTKTTINTNKVKEYDSIQSKLELLEKEIYVLNSKIDRIPKNVIIIDTVYVERNNFNTDTPKSRIVRVDTVLVKNPEISKKQNFATSNSERQTTTAYDTQLAELNRKYDQLLYNQSLLLSNSNSIPIATEKTIATDEIKPVKATSTKETSITDSKKAVAVEQKKATVVGKTIQPSVLVQPTKTIQPLIVRDTVFVKSNPVVQKSENNVVYDMLIEKYGQMKKSILFENNSSAIAAINQTTLFEIMSIINQNTTVDVYLEGFASKKGNPTYNEKLSLERTEEVKEYLISKGIHPTRILSHYHGIDFSAKDEQSARRVDLTFIVRR